MPTLIKFLTVLCLCFMSVLSSAQQDNTRVNRNDFKLNLAVDGDTFYESDVKAGPYIVGKDVLQIYPSEKVLLEVEQEHGVIKSLKVVKENRNPAKTIEVSFDQKANGKKHELMMLKIKNPFNMELKYRTSIFLMKESKWKSSNVLPVPAGLSSFETWPDIIVTIALDQWEFAKGI